MQYSFLRFLLVGLVNTFVGLSIMYGLLHFAGLSYWLSTFSGNLSGAFISFMLNKSFTFRSQASIYETLYRFIIVIGSCYLLSYFIGIRSAFWLLQKLVDLPVSYVEEMAILLGTGFYTILNYFGQRQFVFSK